MDSLKLNPRAKIRLHRYLALCGLGSRRACENLIGSGRVSVDGVIVRRQGGCVDPAGQKVQLDGKPAHPEKKVYLVMNKPRDVLCTSHDPQGRRTFKALLPPSLAERVYTVGRLDRNTEGLLVVTNDGELAHALMHPRHNVEKVYQVWTARQLTLDQEQRLKKGIDSKGETLLLEALTRYGVQPDGGVYQVRLREGRHRHIRRMFEAVGARIVRLQRMAIGPLRLGALRSGGWRYLDKQEIKILWRSVLGKNENGQGGLP